MVSKLTTCTLVLIFYVTIQIRNLCDSFIVFSLPLDYLSTLSGQNTWFALVFSRSREASLFYLQLLPQLPGT